MSARPRPGDRYRSTRGVAVTVDAVDQHGVRLSTRPGGPIMTVPLPMFRDWFAREGES